MNSRGYSICLVLALMGGPLEAGVPERFEIASEPIETNHVKWAKPLPGDPVRVLCLAPIPSQRDVLELAQRLEMEYDLVAFQDIPEFWALVSDCGPVHGSDHSLIYSNRSGCHQKHGLPPKGFVWGPTWVTLLSVFTLLAR